MDHLWKAHTQGDGMDVIEPGHEIIADKTAPLIRFDRPGIALNRKVAAGIGASRCRLVLGIVD